MGWLENITQEQVRSPSNATELATYLGTGGGGSRGSNYQRALGTASRQAYGLTFDENGNVITPGYVGIDPNASAALGRAAAGPSNFLGMAQPFYEEMIAGRTNPYLDATYSRAYDQLRNKLDTQFSMAGRYGSDAHQNVMADAASNLANQLYGGAYESDMARRMQALQMASGLDQQTYQNLINQYQAGLLGQAQGQSAQDYEYDAAMQRINDYLATLQGVQGAKPQETPRVNPLVQGLGLASQAAGIYGSLTG